MKRRLLAILMALAVALPFSVLGAPSVAAQIQTCTIFGTVYQSNGQPFVGAKIIVHRVRASSVSGPLLSTVPQTYLTNSQGAFSFLLPRDSWAWIEAPLDSLFVAGGVPVYIPNAGSAELKTLPSNVKLPQQVPVAFLTPQSVLDPGAAGVVVRTSQNVTIPRSIAVGSNLSIINANGVDGNPTINLGSNVVTSVLNETNLQGSISASQLTLAWAGALVKGRQHAATVYSDQGNTFSAGAQDFGSAASLKVPIGAGAAPTVSGQIAYNTTDNLYKAGVNGVNKTFLYTDGDGSLLTSLNASQLESGTIPNGRFPSVLPAASGANLTALNASQLASGLIPAARGQEVWSLADLIGVPAIGSTNQILGVVNAGGSHEYKSVLGTTNQVNVTHGANSITLSTPQNIHTGATPQFARLGIGVAADPTLALLVQGVADLSSLRDGGGQVFNVKAAPFNAKGDGVTNDAPAIQAAIDACAAAGGGIVYFPQTTSFYAVASTLTIGNGTSTTISTYHGVSFVGAGGNRLNASSTDQACMIAWTGSTSTSNVVLKVAGPIGGVRIADLLIHCDNKAGIGIQVQYGEATIIDNVGILAYTAVGLDIDAYDTNTFTGQSTNNSGNTGQVRNLMMVSLNNNVTGVRLGATGNIAQWTFVGGAWRMDGTTGSNGILARFTDHITFDGVVVAAAAGLRLKPIASQASFPMNLQFIGATSVTGSTGANAVAVDDTDVTWAPTPGYGVTFLTFQTADGASIPTDPRIRGLSDTGVFFGLGGQQYSAVTSSTAIANTTTETAFSKTFSIPANSLRAGDVVQVTAAGRYSTTGTPTIVLRGRVGGTTVADPIVATASGATNFQWSFTYEFIVRTTGASGSTQRGFNLASTGGGSAGSGASSQTFTLDTTAAKTIDITAQWSAASASNTIQLDALDVHVRRALSAN